MSNPSPSTPDLNLQGLVRSRQSEAVPADPRHSSWSGFLRRAFPATILLGFAALLTWATRESWLPTTEVTVSSVVISSTSEQQAGAALFQAAGWIEPSPSPVKATALADGVVAEVFVVAGQAVTAGQPVVTLIDTDAQLALRRKRAVSELRQAELAQAQAAATAAAQRLKYPTHLEAEVAQGLAALARNEIEVAKLPFLLQAAQSQVTFAETLWNNRETAKDSVAGRLVNEAKMQLDAANVALAELQQREQWLIRERAALADHVAAVKQKLALGVSEHQAVAETNAAVAAAQARLTEAELDVEHAALVVDRMIVRAPISGRILQRLAEPGSMLMGLDSMGGHQSSAVATLYDPNSLQVRADVRLEDFAKVVPDQEVMIETATWSQPLTGRVLLSTSTANIQKNTVEVKVAIIDPPDVLRPEMLVTATFLAPAISTTKASEKIGQRVLVPRHLILDNDGQPQVWIMNADQRAQRQTVQLGQPHGEHLIQVVAGLTLTDKLIDQGRERLRDGTRVHLRSR